MCLNIQNKVDDKYKWCRADKADCFSLQNEVFRSSQDFSFIFWKVGRRRQKYFLGTDLFIAGAVQPLCISSQCIASCKNISHSVKMDLRPSAVKHLLVQPDMKIHYFEIWKERTWF